VSRTSCSSGWAGRRSTRRCWPRCTDPRRVPRLRVLDSTDPGAVLDAERNLPWQATVLVPASKSGTTVEMACHLARFRARLEDAHGTDAGRWIVPITDPGSALDAEATDRGYRTVVHGQPDVGGRFSALTPFGLLPAALLGMDLDRHLAAARRELAAARSTDPDENSAAALGATMATAARNGRDKLALVLPDGLESFGRGSNSSSPSPRASTAAGSCRSSTTSSTPSTSATTGSSSRSVTTRARGPRPRRPPGGAAAVERAGAARRRGRAVGVRDRGRRGDAGPEPVRPARRRVRQGGDRARAGRRRGPAPDRRPHRRARGGAAGGLRGAPRLRHPGGDDHRQLEAAADRLRHRLRAAVTVGIGPRYLHSTGQLHKGGPDTGVFLVVVGDDPEDADIPGRDFTFGRLKRAQAAGDLAALRDAGRRALHVSPATLGTLCRGDAARGSEVGLDPRVTADPLPQPASSPSSGRVQGTLCWWRTWRSCHSCPSPVTSSDTASQTIVSAPSCGSRRIGPVRARNRGREDSTPGVNAQPGWATWKRTPVRAAAGPTRG
jgi:hypothetical protein